MIDFKKEIQKYQPIRTVEELQDGVVTDEIKDISELLQYIANIAKNGDGSAKQTHQRAF